MTPILSDLDDAIEYINSIYEFDSTPPSAGEEDYVVWTSLLNVAKNLWATEEGVLWKELFVNLADAVTGDTVTVAGQHSYTCPDDFVFPASAYVWTGDGANKTPHKIFKIEDLQLYENNVDSWCYFVGGATPTLVFNSNTTIHGGETISYPYYKSASKLVTGTDKLEMSDPMAAVFYVVGELKKEEGDSSALQVLSQKIEGMKTKNMMPAWIEDYDSLDRIDLGLGT